VPSALQCYTWPDGTVTQTFDPQSPPCIADWPGQKDGNGGATATGVSATTIRIAYPQVSSTSSGISSYAQYMQPLLDFVNTHFQLYGRSFKLVPFPSAQLNAGAGGGFYTDATPQHADAEQAASLHVFAATDFVDYAGPIFTLTTQSYAHTLAARHVISLIGGSISPLLSPGDMAKHAPYEWSYLPTSTQLLSNAGQMICRSLAGKPGRHATAYTATTRKFAIVIPSEATTGGPLVGLGQLKSALASCGLNPPVVEYHPEDSSGGGDVQAQFVQLRSQGVTSLIFWPPVQQQTGDPRRAASNIGWNPEWVLVGWSAWCAALQTYYGPAQSAAAFGVGGFNKLNQLEQTPWFQSYLAAAGHAPAARSMYDNGNAFYHELLLLASGVQMAGPHLTPESFAKALHNTEFPNPGAGAAPSYQARVGFPGSSVSMVSDYAGFWLAPDVTYAEMQREALSQDYHIWQALCWVKLGRRYHDTTWPTTDDFQTRACR
jgi:hypothetical protein